MSDLPSAKEVFTRPLIKDNPVMIQVLGICSSLAVSSNMKTALVMSLALTFVTAFSNLIISSIRKSKIIYTIMIILEQLSIINYFLFFKDKIYSVYKPAFLIICVLTILFSILWIFKKINNKLMMITLLFSQLEELNWIINNGKDTKLFSFVLTFYIFVLLLHILPIFVIKKQ